MADSSKRSPVDVAIIGMGALFPEAEDLGGFWENLLRGRDSIKDIPLTHWRPDDYFNVDPKAIDRTYGTKGGFLSPYPFEPLKFGLSPHSIEATDTSQLLGMLVAHQAMIDAGYGPDDAFDKDRVSCIMGVTGTLELVIPLGARLGHPHWKKALREAGVSDDVAADVMARMSDSYVGWQEASFPGLLGNVVAGRIANRMNLGGTNTVCDSACGSSLSAIKTAVMELVTGSADMVISGGVDTFNDIFMYMCFSKTPALSPRGHAHSYDANGDGTTLGEGLGVVVLKRLKDAQRDGDRIYAVIKGVGSSSDGKGKAIYAPSSEGQAKALANCYHSAGIDPRTVGLLEGHGTGTKVGDGVEINGLKLVFGEGQETECALGSVKSQIGHAKAAAGAAGLIKAAMALYTRVLPPTIKVDAPHPHLRGSRFYLNGVSRPWYSPSGFPRRAGVSAFGFGGSNFHCVLEEAPSGPSFDAMLNDIIICPFIAASDELLRASLAAFPDCLTWREYRAVGQQLAKAVKKDPQGPRLVIILRRGGPEIKSLLSEARKMTYGDGQGSHPLGVFYSRSPKKEKLAVLFPGQGSQYPGMLRDLALRLPEIQNWLFDLEDMAPELKILDAIYPVQLLPNQNMDHVSKDLTRTDRAQPAIGVLSAGAYRALERFGLEVDMFAGHSFGELTALWASGCFDDQTFRELAIKRGAYMADVSPDLGGMIAVSADEARLQTFVSSHKLQLSLSNHNAPEQVVLGGPHEELDRALSLLKSEGLKAKKLSVGAAFHSSLVADAAKPFSSLVNRVVWRKMRKSVYSNTTGKSYPSSNKAKAKLLGEQLARPVKFSEQVKRMYDEGARIFLEVGPHRRLSGLVSQNLAGKEIKTLSLDQSGCGVLSLAKCLCDLWVLGQPIDFALWDHDPSLRYESPGKKRMTVPLTGANYFKPPEPRPVADKASVEPHSPLRTVAKKKTMTMEAANQHRGWDKKPLKKNDIIRNKTVVKERDFGGPKSQPLTSSYATGAMNVLQESLLALQSLQMQNAKLHEEYLLGQRVAQEMFGRLLERQQDLLAGVPISPSAKSPGSVVSPRGRHPQGRAEPVISDESSGMTQMPQSLKASDVPASMPEPVSVPIQTRASKRPPSVSSNQLTGAKMEQTGEKHDSDVAPKLVQVIAEKTGYPAEMIELEMSLEGDLGIDSIKRVEIMAALQEVYPAAAKEDPEELSSLNTVGEIVDKFHASHSSPSVVSQPVEDLMTRVCEIISEKTGYPSEMLASEMDLEADLGIDSIKRVEIFASLGEAYPSLDSSVFASESSSQIRTLGDLVAPLERELSGKQEVSQRVTGAVSSKFDMKETLIKVVSEKTGYPEDMITLDMALEADLGIDSIKRVEILAALRDKEPLIDEASQEALSQAPTLEEVLSLLKKPSAPAQHASRSHV